MSSSCKKDIDVVAKNLHRSHEVVQTCKYKPIAVCNLLFIQKTPVTRLYNMYVHSFFGIYIQYIRMLLQNMPSMVSDHHFGDKLVSYPDIGFNVEATWSGS